MTPLTDLSTWQAANDAYLAQAVNWIRLELTKHALTTPAPPPLDPRPLVGATPVAPVPPVGSPDREVTGASWWKFRRTTVAPEPAVTPAPAPGAPPRLALPSSSLESLQQSINEVREQLNVAERADPPPALVVLARRLGLSAFERDLLMLTVAMELDTRLASLCAHVQDDAALPFPTFGLAFTLFDEPGWDARSPQHPLRYWRLVEVNQPWGQPLTTSALRADERIVNFVKGLSHLDDRLTPYVTPLQDAGDEGALPPSHHELVDQILHAVERDRPALRPIHLLGPDAESKQAVAGAVAQHLGLSLYRVQADTLPSQPVELETLARLWQRETLLLPVALSIDASNVDRASEAHATALKRFLARASGLVFVESRETWMMRERSHSFDVDKPSAVEQRALWLAALGPDTADAAEEAAELSSQFSLGAASIARIAAGARADDGTAPLRERVHALAMAQTRLRLDALAQRIDAKATFDDIVLPASEAGLLRQIAAHVSGRGIVYDEWGFRDRMNRGFGVSALFVGPSGTGKTMAAEVIANELGLSLHRIDLSSVVSKWVGETEKNLQQVFNAADDANGILFFDEADALFGKRTEVQQSQDRFANIEINFLLQRLESYRGLAILATNMKSALDQAFLRRLRFIVHFPFPGPAERKAIWQRAFPSRTPTAGLDFERLAQLPLPGGSIHNVALASAFLAARRRAKVTMPIVFEAAKTEMRKMEKPVHEADFAWTEPVGEVVS